MKVSTTLKAVELNVPINCIVPCTIISSKNRLNFFHPEVVQDKYLRSFIINA